jgi:hypothetical protein
MEYYIHGRLIDKLFYLQPILDYLSEIDDDITLKLNPSKSIEFTTPILGFYNVKLTDKRVDRVISINPIVPTDINYYTDLDSINSIDLSKINLFNSKIISSAYKSTYKNYYPVCVFSELKNSYRIHNKKINSSFSISKLNSNSQFISFKSLIELVSTFKYIEVDQSRNELDLSYIHLLSYYTNSKIIHPSYPGELNGYNNNPINELEYYINKSYIR